MNDFLKSEASLSVLPHLGDETMRLRLGPAPLKFFRKGCQVIGYFFNHIAKLQQCKPTSRNFD
jgi:hypothetical protein